MRIYRITCAREGHERTTKIVRTDSGLTREQRVKFWAKISGIGTFFDIPEIKRPKVGKNCRFFFTKKGWERHGKKFFTWLMNNQPGFNFRLHIDSLKNYDIIYRDKNQVAVRYKRRRL